MLGINPRELPARNSERRAELSFVLGTEGYRGWPAILEILNNERSTSSNSLICQFGAKYICV